MKKFKFSGVFFLFLFVFLNQMVFGDIIIRKDNGDPGTVPNAATKLGATSFSAKTTLIPVTADIVGSELIVDFTTSVGTAYVSVVDNNGNVVYITVVDTFSTSEVVIPVDGMSSGNYSLKISYGSTKLIGDFQL